MKQSRRRSPSSREIATGFDAKKLLDHLVQVVANLRMPNVKAVDDSTLPAEVPLINLSNLKHAIVPLYYAPDQWIAYSSRLGRPDRTPLFGANLDAWWSRAQ